MEKELEEAEGELHVLLRRFETMLESVRDAERTGLNGFYDQADLENAKSQLKATKIRVDTIKRILKKL